VQLKRYQEGVLERTRAFLDALRAERDGGNARFGSRAAWERVTRSSRYRDRRNGLGLDLPDVWLKVPTGGGKTLLATHVLGQVYSTLLRERNGRGLALWVVPSDAIYRQTLEALKDPRHEYRVALEQAVGSRVEVWEKREVTRLRPSHLFHALNVLLLKLPSANRADRETLKVFQDSGGGIVDHFPPEDDDRANRALLERIPNLDRNSDDLVKTSVGNLVRLCEPPVVMDEGHRALSDLARETIAGFNPAILLQLSATPPADANVLASVTGRQLLDEEMIKLPVNVLNSEDGDWRTVLSKAADKRKELERVARRAAEGGGRRIRPIVLVQVERTGREQRGGALVHAEDVRAHLVERLGVPEAEIKVKSSERDDIEGIDLLDESCVVTWIVTRSALQEGWDCPFAYVLVSLANTGSARAMTQLVGRVLRQPWTRRTGEPALDESYVFCRKAKASEVVRRVKEALEREGYEGDLAGVVDRSDGGGPVGRPRAPMRERFRRLYRAFDGKVYLPRFCVRDEDGWSGLDYHRHLLSTVDVATFDYARIDWRLEDAARAAKETFYRVTIGEGDPPPLSERSLEAPEDDAGARAWLEANLPFEHFGYRDVRKIVDRTAERVLAREPGLGGRLSLVKYAIRDRLADFVRGETDRATERAFRALFDAGRIQFYLDCVQCRFELPPSVEVRSVRRLTDDQNREVAKSLFEWAAAEEFNEYERSVALCVDRHPEVLWWYRNAVGRECFSIQGYRRDRVYPDFVVQKGTESRPEPTVVVVEAKGAHLVGHPDTDYKRDLAAWFQKAGKRVTWQSLGKGFESSTVRFQVLDEGAWREQLAEALSPAEASA
jgi:type III restriction enzyme